MGAALIHIQTLPAKKNKTLLEAVDVQLSLSLSRCHSVASISEVRLNLIAGRCDWRVHRSHAEAGQGHERKMRSDSGRHLQ